MPILALLESIHSILMDWFSQKRQLEVNTLGIIVRKVATQIQDAKNHQARRYRFKYCIGMQYEVKSNQTLCDYLVNIEQQTCSCRQWQAMGIPCGHSIRIIVNGLKEDPHTYTKMFYILEAFNNTYARVIMHPHSNIDYSQPLKPDSLPPSLDHENDLSGKSDGESEEIVHSDSEENDDLLAPNTHKRIGRPPKKRK